MPDEASIGASRINHPPSSSLRHIPCSEDAMGCTVRTVLRWTKLIFEAIAAESTKVSPSRHWVVLHGWWRPLQGLVYQQSELTTPLPSAGSKARPSHSSCTLWLLWDPCHTTGNQPAEESAVPTQSTNMWLVRNAYFMSEQMAFLWPICHKYTGNRITCHKSTLYYK